MNASRPLRSLPAAVAPHKSRVLLSVIGEAVISRNSGISALERADLEGYVSCNNAAFLPFLNHLHVQILTGGIIILPEIRCILRDFSGLVRRKRLL